MTRINPLYPEAVCILSDDHLGAAWTEYPRVITHVENRLSKGMSFEDIPEEFTFNAGHVTFFYDKLDFIMDSLDAIYQEATTHREFEYDKKLLDSYRFRIGEIRRVHPHLVRPWQPTPDEVYLGLARLVSRKFPGYYEVKGRSLIRSENNLK